MIRLLTATVILVCIVATPTLADGIEVLFDFEDQELGLVDPLNPNTGSLLLEDAATGLRVSFDRVSDILGGGPELEVVDLGDPSFGFGSRSLSPFINTVANEFVGYLRITIDTTNLFDPSLQVGRVDWDMGDYVPSDNDDLYISSDTALGTLEGYVEYDNSGYAPPFGSSTYTLIRAENITKIRMFGGTGAQLEGAANSVFYDNFLFSLVNPGTYSLDDETPISSLGGGPSNPGLGPQDGPNGGTPTVPPIPEPASLFAVATGLALLGLRFRRKSR